MTEATHRKTQLRLSPNKAQTEKENPCYHLSGVALLPNSYQMITKKGHNIPLVKSDPFPYLALFGLYIISLVICKNKVFSEKLLFLIQKTTAERINLSAAILRLVVNYIVIYDFCGSAADIGHPSNPLHLIVCFELFGCAFTFCHLFYKLKNTKCLKALCFQGISGIFVIIPTRFEVLSHSYFSPYFGLIPMRFLSFCFVFLCILCALSPFGTVLVSKFGINFLKNRRRKNPLFFLSK